MKDIRDEQASEDARKMRKGEKGVKVKQKAEARDWYGKAEDVLNGVDVVGKMLGGKVKKTIAKEDKAKPKAKAKAKAKAKSKK